MNFLAIRGIVCIVTVCSYFCRWRLIVAFDREAFLNVLEDSYSAYYNIVKEGFSESLPLVFRADYFKRDERYWLTKSVKYYGNETNEMVYVFTAPVFDRAAAAECIQFAMDDGLPRVKPHKEHQYTNIKVIFLADDFSEDALKEIESRKFQKSYHFSLWGYTNLITAAVNVKEEKTWTNAAGRDMKKYFTKLFTAQKKNTFLTHCSQIPPSLRSLWLKVFLKKITAITPENGCLYL